jgi:hypothetical protein
MMTEETAGCTPAKATASRAADTVRHLGQLLRGRVLGGVGLAGGIKAVPGKRGPASGQVRLLAPAVPAGQEAPRERRPGEDSHAESLAGWQDVRFDTAGQHRIGRLLGAEAHQAASLGDVIGLDDLLGRERRASERPDLPGPDQVREGREGLLDVGRGVRAVDLVQVDPVGPQPAEAVLHLREDPAPGVAAAIGPIAHLEVHLRCQDDVVATALERLADDLLRLPA